jgi:nucleotidyltransferase substrate binding protein (TIGR01987 family)
MTKQNIINQVKEIILKFAKPERIYLYGSQANGEASPASDIDIAYDDKDFLDIEKINEEVDKIDTLIKIDVKNIALSGERFRNRVKSTGKVLFSSSKKLRFEDSLYNFEQSYERLRYVVERNDEFQIEGFSDVYLDVVVKRFEFTFEMSWKAIKRYLDFNGIDCKSPRACFKEAFAMGLIKDENIWFEIIEQRNLSSHIYDENEVSEILIKIKVYLSAFNELLNQLKINFEKEI